jgi:hypothetical protein
MLSSVWDFVKDSNNQAVLSWLGGGVVAVVGGIWAVVKFRTKSGEEKPSRLSVSADRGSVAAGGNIVGSPVNTDARDSSKR